MKFLERTLEDIISDNIERVHEKGLNILSNPSKSASHYSWDRQVQLGVHGVADMVIVEFNDSSKFGCSGLTITIIECKLNLIDLNTYQQAKRYKYAVCEILSRFNLSNHKIQIKTVLIGSELCKKGDFKYVYLDDKDCTAFTYSYGFDGIQFLKHEKDPVWLDIPEQSNTSKFKSLFLKELSCFIKYKDVYGDEDLCMKAWYKKHHSLGL